MEPFTLEILKEIEKKKDALKHEYLMLRKTAEWTKINHNSMITTPKHKLYENVYKKIGKNKVLQQGLQVISHEWKVLKTMERTLQNKKIIKQNKNKNLIFNEIITKPCIIKLFKKEGNNKVYIRYHPYSDDEIICLIQNINGLNVTHLNATDIAKIIQDSKNALPLNIGVTCCHNSNNNKNIEWEYCDVIIGGNEKEFMFIKLIDTQNYGGYYDENAICLAWLKLLKILESNKWIPNTLIDSMHINNNKINGYLIYESFKNKCELTDFESIMILKSLNINLYDNNISIGYINYNIKLMHLIIIHYGLPSSDFAFNYNIIMKRNNKILSNIHLHLKKYQIEYSQFITMINTTNEYVYRTNIVDACDLCGLNLNNTDMDILINYLFDNKEYTLFTEVEYKLLFNMNRFDRIGEVKNRYIQHNFDAKTYSKFMKFFIQRYTSKMDNENKFSVINVFKKYDINKTGEIGNEYLIDEFKGIGYTHKEALNIIHLFDTDKNGKINFDQINMFVNKCKSINDINVENQDIKSGSLDIHSINMTSNTEFGELTPQKSLKWENKDNSRMYASFEKPEMKNLFKIIQN